MIFIKYSYKMYLIRLLLLFAGWFLFRKLVCVRQTEREGTSGFDKIQSPEQYPADFFFSVSQLAQLHRLLGTG